MEEGFKTAEQRKRFVDELLQKVFDFINVEDGAVSEIIRQKYVRKKVLKHAQMISFPIYEEQKAS